MEKKKKAQGITAKQKKGERPCSPVSSSPPRSLAAVLTSSDAVPFRMPGPAVPHSSGGRFSAVRSGGLHPRGAGAVGLGCGLGTHYFRHPAGESDGCPGTDQSTYSRCLGVTPSEGHRVQPSSSSEAVSPTAHSRSFPLVPVTRHHH